MIERFPLRRFEDDRGWFSELGRVSELPKPFRQANLSFSRKGVIRGLHYHERGQDDLFVCLQGMVRVVVLDRDTGEVETEDIGDENPMAIYVPGAMRTGSRRSPIASSVTSSRRSSTPPIPTSKASRGTIRGSSTSGARHRRSSQRGTRPRHPDHRCRRAARPGPRGAVPRRRGAHPRGLGHPLPLPLGGSGRTWPGAPRRRLDGCGRRRGRPAGRGSRERRRNPARRRARRAARRLFVGLRLRRLQAVPVPRVRRPESARRLRAHQVPRRSRCGERGVDRALLMALRAGRQELRPHDAPPRGRS